MGEPRLRAPAAPRFEIATSATFVTIVADRLRLNAYEDLGRFLISVSASGDEREQAPFTFDLAKQDAPAFRRAVKAFNAILDEHEAKIAASNQRRRKLLGTLPPGGQQSRAADPLPDQPLDENWTSLGDAAGSVVGRLADRFGRTPASPALASNR